jgi:lysozyme family protein
VDGVLGADTIKALQRKVGAPADGQLGPVTWRAVDVWLGVTPPNGVPGRDTIRALQRKVGSAADGILGVNTIRALQRWLNNHR